MMLLGGRLRDAKAWLMIAMTGKVCLACCRSGRCKTWLALLEEYQVSLHGSAEGSQSLPFAAQREIAVCVLWYDVCWPESHTPSLHAVATSLGALGMSGSETGKLNPRCDCDGRKHVA